MNFRDQCVKTYTTKIKSLFPSMSNVEIENIKRSFEIGFDSGKHQNMSQDAKNHVIQQLISLGDDRLLHVDVIFK